jgi:capsular polysaccharide biosynthesis protein
MRANRSRFRDTVRSWKRTLRAPLLRSLRGWAWYRRLTGVPRNDIVSCRDYVRGLARRGGAFIPLDEPARVDIPSERDEPGDGPGIFGSLRWFDLPATFVATLSECRLYGRGVAVVGADGRLIAEGSAHIGGSPADHAIMGRAFLPRPVRLPGTTAILSAPAGNTYYHWLFDVVPRIALLIRAGVELKRVDRFATNSVRRRYQIETLAAFEIDRDRVVETDSVRHATCETMLLPSYAGVSGFPPRWACYFLRKAFLRDAASGAQAGPRWIYVSRQRSGTRRIENGADVERRLAFAGFATVHPEDHGVAEQARLFRGARLIVAPHGSGLSNIVFAEPGARLLELFPPDWTTQSHYRVLAAQAGVHHAALVGESGKDPRARGDFVVPLARLESLLARLT